MVDSKLTFRIQEVPEGKSDRRIPLECDELELDGLKMNHAVVDIHFYKTDHFIKTDFEVTASVQLTCDRSLEEFEYNSKGAYSVLFEPTVESTSEDESIRIKEIDSHKLTISIEKDVRDTIMLGLPIKKIHPRYLDNEGNPLDYETKTFGGRDNEEDPIDPRWETLKKLKN